MSTITSERLIFTDLQNNNNKFWHGEVDKNVVNCSWGRVGDAGQSKSFVFSSETQAQAFLAKKADEKLRKGYTRQQTMSGGFTPVVSSVSVLAKTQIESRGDTETTALIEFLVQRNIHNIEGTTSIKLESGKLTTPLGPVTATGLDQAQLLLEEMSTYPANFDTLVNRYMRIIPRTIGRGRTNPMDLFGTQAQLEREQETIDSLRAVLTDLEQNALDQASTLPVPRLFSARLELVDDKDKQFSVINKAFKDGLNRNHQSANMNLFKVWAMTITPMAEAFESSIGNVKRLWHGTKDANLLSILKNGYVIAGRGSKIAITGRMFGDGVYFSDQSTKSLNYASGYWGGGRSARCFMILNDVAMGKEYVPRSSFSGGIPKGYDSCFAKAGQSGVMNNEMIVYRTSQINPVYLVEFR